MSERSQSAAFALPQCTNPGFLAHEIHICWETVSGSDISRRRTFEDRSKMWVGGFSRRCRFVSYVWFFAVLHPPCHASGKSTEFPPPSIHQNENGKISDDALVLLSKAASGSVRDAISLLETALLNNNIEDKKLLKMIPKIENS